MGQHFVAFVKGDDNNLWELEGGRKGPICRGTLGPDEDVLSPAALEMSMGKLMRIESEASGGKFIRRQDVCLLEQNRMLSQG